ncbi:hypothetical protein HBI56_143450 [Parastagonospora nodorum]|nr:hypothetical protein HBH56_033600 [Parastagonospora nodorum]KAH3933889.1 hypothetical protein HBH54_065830 [Parastagonospora nodorum]KAH3979933.1 hypothetical protein HBH51_055240 [Parastagonospora nodorum]KAH4002109.1 hypothetical protein HBI10_082810 [Parastagonospora nodorum]KAH4031770.1 hypothetical protein HBI13_015310 [Parastagonospora nodorum]
MPDMSYMNNCLKIIVSSLAYKILQKMQTRAAYEVTTPASRTQPYYRHGKEVNPFPSTSFIATSGPPTQPRRPRPSNTHPHTSWWRHSPRRQNCDTPRPATRYTPDYSSCYRCSARSPARRSVQP